MLHQCDFVALSGLVGLVCRRGRGVAQRRPSSPAAGVGEPLVFRRLTRGLTMPGSLTRGLERGKAQRESSLPAAGARRATWPGHGNASLTRG
jgi:hypothetical protein